MHTMPRHAKTAYAVSDPIVRGLVLLVLLAGCGGQQPVVTEVLNYGQCQKVLKGVHEISFQQLATVRGSRLLQPPGTDSAAAAPDAPPGVALVSVYAGARPTAGYALHLREAKQQADQLQLHYEWQEPAADAVVAQVISQPCSVVQIDYAPDTSAPGQEPHGKVSAWLDGNQLGEISF